MTNYLTPQDRLDIANDPVGGLEAVAKRIAERATDKALGANKSELVRTPTDYFYVRDGQMFYRNGVSVGEVYQEVDGYWVIANLMHGAYNDWELQAMGRVLEKMNRPWANEIRKAFEDGV